MPFFPLQEAAYTFEGQEINLFFPEEKAVQQWYAQNNKNKAFPFPFWARIWPAAIGMCCFLGQNAYLVDNKTVLELAGGLGLPSLLAAAWARQVTCTDISGEAVRIVQKSAAKNNLHNLEAFTLDWNTKLPAVPDVLLLSDVNYNPGVFDDLYSVLERHLKAGTTIILSTPQRLAAKSFINRLMPFCTRQETIFVGGVKEPAAVTILILQKTP